jgi:hypothetical protein|tara:strand:- start:972 stop:1175 length:204 start_codon:yes stop_codon:yes gene_type:complete
MNPKQITHFVYWLQERTDLRGIQTEKNPNRNATPLTPRIKLATIEDLQDEFLKKYPEGILSGFEFEV